MKIMTKKIFALILALLMVVSFGACGEKETPKSQAELDAEKGILSGVHFALGTSGDEIIRYYKAEIEKNGEESDYLQTGNFDGYSSITTLGDIYYFEEGKEGEGALFSASFAKVWDYEIGISMKDEIKEQLAGETEEYTATEEQLFFFPSFEENCEVLAVKCGEYKLSFYFVNGFLAASSLQDLNNWTISE